jgi:hypothetical protein
MHAYILHGAYGCPHVVVDTSSDIIGVADSQTGKMETSRTLGEATHRGTSFDTDLDRSRTWNAFSLTEHSARLLKKIQLNISGV